MSILYSNQASTRSVSIKVNLNALRENMCVVAKLAGKAQRFATIKADAYGHGALAVAHALSAKSKSAQFTDASAFILKQGCAHGFANGFAVVTLDEALELRQSGIEEPILLLQGPQTKDAVSTIVRNALWPVIHDPGQYEWFSQCTDAVGVRAWLKVDTGMGRLGVSVEQANQILSKPSGIRWQGLLTHFASADETANSYTAEQCHRFKQVSLLEGMTTSLANSSAVLAWPEAHGDWVRPGIMLYGCNPLDRELPDEHQLKPVMSVEAPLISSKRLSRGASVGYGQSWQCPENMPIGYVGLGYGDGLPRVLDANATVTVAGTRCPIVGRVSMDSVAIDLRPVGQMPIGTTVQFWGEHAMVGELANSAGTISYELLTSIRGSRQYTDENPDSVS